MFKFKDAGFYGMKEKFSDKQNNKFANCPLGKKIADTNSESSQGRFANCALGKACK